VPVAMVAERGRGVFNPNFTYSAELYKIGSFHSFVRTM
jgi:hypothetical protein